MPHSFKRLMCLLMVCVPAIARAQSAQTDIDLLSRAGVARTIGPDTARVVLIEFFDFACPTCQAFHMLRGDSLRKAIGPDVRIAYVNFLITHLLRGYHAAEAANCASMSGGHSAYMAVADRLYRHPDEWKDIPDPTPVFTRYGKEAGLDSAAFASCRARDAAAPLIVSDIATANTFQVTGTPTFVAVPRGAKGAGEAFSISGNVSIAELLDLIAKARAKAQ